MTTTQEKIKVMQAFVDGKEIEFRNYRKSDWVISADPIWNWIDNDYRVKKTEYVVITGTMFHGMRVVEKDQFTNNSSMWPLNEYKVVHEFEL